MAGIQYPVFMFGFQGMLGRAGYLAPGFHAMMSFGKTASLTWHWRHADTFIRTAGYYILYPVAAGATLTWPGFSLSANIRFMFWCHLNLHPFFIIRMTDCPALVPP